MSDVPYSMYDSKNNNLKFIQMKKNLIILCLMTVSSLAYSQVGINTPNPQGTFHIDGAKDNAETGTPTAAQQANDFTVTSTGNVGVGTTAPAAKLDVVGNIKITDGTEGDGKILVSDTNGQATWQATAATRSIVQGVLATGVNVSNTAIQTGTYIDLPPGRWVVLGTMTININGLTNNQSAVMHTSFSDSAANTVRSIDVVTNGASGVWISGVINGPSPFGVFSGNIIINNNSGVTKRYFYYARLEAALTALSFGGNVWGENQLFAFPIN